MGEKSQPNQVTHTAYNDKIDLTNFEEQNFFYHTVVLGGNQYHITTKTSNYSSIHWI